MKWKVREAVASAKHLQADICSMTMELDALVAKYKEFSFKVQCMPSLAEGEKSLCTRRGELEAPSKTKSTKEGAQRRIEDMKMVAEQVCLDRAEHTAWIAHLDGTIHELVGKLEFLQRHNDVVDSRYSRLVDEFDLLKLQVASSRVCN